MVIPKKHYHTLLDVPHEELKELMGKVQKVAAAVMSTVPGMDGFNIIQSNKESAGQVIPHLHFHIIPRSTGDNLDFSWEQGKAEQKQLENYDEMMKEKL